MSDARALCRRRVYLGEGLQFELETHAARLYAEAIDLTPQGVGLAVLRAPVLPAVGERVSVRYTGRGASGAPLQALVRHSGVLRSGGRILPRLGLELLPESAGVLGRRWPCPDALPAFATAACPWAFRETLRLRIGTIGARGMTVRASSAQLLPGAALDLDLHLPYVGVEHARGRVASTRRGEIGVAWIEPPRALAEYLLASDRTLTPAALRAAGLRVGGVERTVSYGYATSSADHDEILGLRLLAHQAQGHLATMPSDDLRSPFDAHSRHLVCRFGGRIVGYVRVIFVDGVPARSQYVAVGGHEVPPWLWEAGFVEAGAGAMHPDFQRCGLFVPLMAHAVRVAVQSGHRFVLGACDDGLLGMYREMGFEVLEQRTVEPRPGWRFRSHLIGLDAERLADAPPAIAAAIGFAGPTRIRARRPAAVAASAPTAARSATRAG